MYSADFEKEQGFSNALGEMIQDIKGADALIISVNEHNGGPSAYFKNLLDWLSRVNGKFMDGKKILLLSTSPGKRGGMSSLAIVKEILPRFGGGITAAFSLPSFFDNFDVATGITDENLARAHREALDVFLKSI
jgi:NAD(P)H-dependent FMN reductase